MVQTKRIIVVYIRYFKSVFAVFGIAHPCIAQVVSVLVNITVFLNLYIKTTTDAVVFIVIGAKSGDFVQLWLLIYLTPKFENSKSKGKATTFAVALLLLHHGTSVTLAPSGENVLLLVRIQLIMLQYDFF